MAATSIAVAGVQYGKAHRTMASLYLIVLVAIVVTLLYSMLTYDKRRKFLPPGPRGLPLIGNMLDFADSDQLPEITRKYAEYGDITRTKVGGTEFIWLNTPTAVKGLMDKRGSKYSSRPPAPMAYDAGSGQQRQIFMPYGEKWRNLRKVTHAALNMPTSNSYRPVQDFESKQVMYELLHAKDEWAFYDINRRYSASVILTITYGHRVSSWEDPVIKDVYNVLSHFTLMSEPGAWLVDAFPSLARLPAFLFQNWWNVGQQWFREDSAVYLKLYREMVRKVEAGTAPDCFVKDFYLAQPEKHGIDEVGAAYAAGSMVEAGSESTSTVINAWIMACLLYPETMKAAQEEVDRMVGGDRLPSFEDEPNLPYIRAMAKEALRWWPITKVGANHAASEDDWYMGYFIPKGAVVMLNWWAIHFDPKRWKDAEDYNPERYLDDPYTSAEALNVANPDHRDHYTYGAGRRVCAGIHVAQNSLFITMARTIWAFNVIKATGKEGNPIEVTPKTEPGFLMVPARFPAVLKPRSEQRAKIVESAWQDAQVEGLTWTRAKRGAM